ncbi:helix-turn-helix domain-containing protein [Streptomyces sp. NPDC053493]|uniref:helix-turn-helix domain-containing protein n=1 Tax=Streptomyces sp. NPDC053493 TaxID=3365705 RepID=UPI0037CD74D9
MAEDHSTLLRALRDQAHLTQEQVAERSGVSVRTIRRLESGAFTNHRMGTVNLLADALGLAEGDRLRLAAALTGASTAAGDAGAGRDEPPAPAPAGPPVHGALADAARELATEVRRRWRREEAQRQVHDPFPLPVRWKPAPADLTDRAENVQRLGPGGTPREVDLGGDLRSMAEVYLRIPSGRLLVLGRAGSGKSVLTIRLALDLLEDPALRRRVPVIFSVGSWDPSTTALRDWLIGRLLRDHPHLARRGPGGATLAAALVDADLILPVLDGFDEIAEGLRRAALDALNATSTPLVLTSRRDEYAEAVRAARAPLVWAGGIELTDLTLDDLADYLPRAARDVPSAAGGGPGAGRPGSAWDGVLAELRTLRSPAHTNLAAVLTTPLMVILARTLYSETPDRVPAELLDATRFPSVKSLDEHLLAGFVPTVYRHRAPERDAAGRRPRTAYDAARAEHWLGHLAHQLVRFDRERQDLAWWQLGDSLSRATRTVAFVLATTVSITLTDWLVGLLLSSLSPGELLLQGALMGPAAGLAFGTVHALVDRSGGGAAFEPARIRLTLRAAHENRLGRRIWRTLTARFGQGLLGGTLMGIGCACALALGRALVAGISLTDPRVIEGTLINMLVLGLILGSAAGLVFGLMATLEVPVDITAAATPVSLLSSNRTTAGRQFLILAPAFTLAIAVGGHLIVHLLQGTVGPLNWGIQDSLFIGAVGGLGGAASYVLAFTAWGRWIVLARFVLPLSGRLPWDPAAFLEDAYHRGVLRQTGAVYQFRHVRLQHHLGRTYRGRHRDFAPATFTAPPTGAE